MSPAVPNGLSGTEIAKALERAGFGHLSTRGSHAKYRKDRAPAFA
jgi:predicted RNA binding protein YcfA (HicA-like mRNA interferase family)